MTDDTHPRPRRRMRDMLWTGCGWICVGLGFVGAVLPVLPTTPLLLLAAFCFGKGSPHLRQWLLDHDIFGGPLRDWHDQGAIRPRFKIMAVATMALVFGASLMASAPALVLWIQGICMGGAATFILTRPNGN